MVVPAPAQNADGPYPLARAKQTLPNGYCGLPWQRRCPHPNACLTCDNLLTASEFLPLHRDRLERTEQLIAAAEETATRGWSSRGEHAAPTARAPGIADR